MTVGYGPYAIRIRYTWMTSVFITIVDMEMEETTESNEGPQ